MLDAAKATCDFYIDRRRADGIPYWDTGAPGLPALGDWGSRPADPFNDDEPVDSSAAAIGAQGLLRLGRFLNTRGQDGARYWQAGLRVADTLFDPAGPYLSQAGSHQGLILHSVYHWPNGWDYVPRGAHVPLGESSQWGDYHAREVALYLCASRKTKLSRISPSSVHRAPMPDREQSSNVQSGPGRRAALITGGTRGIGLGIARTLAHDGWDLLLSGQRNADDVSPVLRDLEGLGVKVE